MQSLPVNNDFSSRYSFLTAFKFAFRKGSKKKKEKKGGTLMRAAAFRFLLTEILSQDSQDGDVMLECCNSL